MKVLFLNTYDNKGGAARATLRLLYGLKRSGVNVRMLVQSKSMTDEIISGPNGVLTKKWHSLRPYFDYSLPFLQIRKRTTFFPAHLHDNLSVKIDKYNPEIIHLNWITGGFLRIETLKEVKSPIVWTLHDMWAFTGGCHYSGDCLAYLEKCGMCPILNSKKDNDLSRKVYLRKKETFSQMDNLHLVAPSRWMAKQASESSLLKNFPVTIIPNGLDTSVFKPMLKTQARDSLGLSRDKTYILYGAIGPQSNKLKGYQLLIQALKRVKISNLELIVFGSQKHGDNFLDGLKIRNLGWIGDEEKLARLYSAADSMVVPSIQETFGQTASEAMACGTPVVAFKNTGVADIVEHQKTGWLAKAFETESLAEGIRWVLSDKDRLKALSLNARERAVVKFDIKLVADQYVALYNKILSSQP